MNCERYARQQQAVTGFNCKLDEWVLKKNTSSDLSLQHDDFSLMLVIPLSQ